MRLTLDDIEDVRNNTVRGQQILELITRRASKQTAGTQTIATPKVATRSRRIQTEPVMVRLTRSKIRELREAAETADEERRRRRLARALAQLS